MELVRKRLSTAELIPPNIRYNPDTDQVQFSPDGGTTWVDTPSADPRHSDAFRYPPLETMDTRCDAAANMRAWLKQFLDQASDILCGGATALSVANAAIPLYELISGGSLTLLAVLTEVAGGLFSLGCTAITAAFDDDVYALIQCIFDCQIGVDGQVSASQFSTIQAHISAQLTTTAALITNAILSLQGEVGLSNAGAIGHETGDCSDCECAWCYNFQDGQRLDDWVAETFGTATPTYSSGAWHSALTGGTAALWVSWSLASAVNLTDAALIDVSDGLNWSIFVNGNGTAFSGTNIWANGAIVGSPFPISVDRIDVFMVQAFNSTARSLSELQFSGTGDAPFGDDNCP
jgi:hypothetical protein